MRKFVPVVLVLFVATLVPRLPASAHSSSTYYQVKWKSDLSQTWKFIWNVPDGAVKSRIRDGVKQWNNLNQPMEFTEGSGTYSSFSPAGSNCSNIPKYKNAVHWRSDVDSMFNGNWFGYTQPCVYASDNNRIWSVQVVFDSTEDWYTGTGDANDGFLNQCVPSCQIDLWSVASHEWGHATGWLSGPCGSHLCDSESICDDNSDHHTMCQTYHQGTERDRSLESHDKHTFMAAY